RRTGNSILLYTWSGVQPGDVLELDRSAVSSSGSAQPITFTVPTDLPALTYHAYTACGSFALAPISDDGLQTAMAVVDLHRCGASTDVLVGAGVPGGFQTYFYADDVPLATTGLMVNGTYAPFAPSTVRVAGPAGNARVTQTIVDRGRTVYRAPGEA